MFQFSFKNRIAFNYLISTALMVLFVYVLIYYIVSYSVYSHVDNDIAAEVANIQKIIGISKGDVRILDSEEWKEKEHQTLNINPIYVQLLNRNRVSVDKSPNLKNEALIYNASKDDFSYYNEKLNGKAIRQIQFPIMSNNKHAGYILIAMSLENANLVLINLGNVLWISYPAILLFLFFTARLIAGRSIKPIKNITKTANAINRENLKSRIILPHNQDELYLLSKTVNDLLDRIENAIKREMQFTSDASHELRTPLAIVKGTLEVLIRKPREKEEYEQKIAYCIKEVDRLNTLVDQLLLLARFENQKITISQQSVALDEIILQSLERFSSKIERLNMAVDFTFSEHFYIFSDPYLTSIVIENLLSNALKYSNPNGRISITLSKDDDSVNCKIADTGIGIADEDLRNIYEQFYRSKSTEHSEIKGTGLGLSIVKRLCTLLHAEISIESREGEGTAVFLKFAKIV